MGNLFTSNTSLQSKGRATMLRSVFELRQLAKGMQQISCDVVFGSPSANCVGTGVCKISAMTSLPEFKLKSRNCQAAPGLLIPHEGGNAISLMIAREMMCVTLMRKQFKNGVLTLLEPCPLPNDIISSLSLKIKVLKPEKYAVEEVDGFFKISFK